MLFFNFLFIKESWKKTPQKSTKKIVCSTTVFNKKCS